MREILGEESRMLVSAVRVLIRQDRKTCIPTVAASLVHALLHDPYREVIFPEYEGVLIPMPDTFNYFYTWKDNRVLALRTFVTGFHICCLDAYDAALWKREENTELRMRKFNLREWNLVPDRIVSVEKAD